MFRLCDLFCEVSQHAVACLNASLVQVIARLFRCNVNDIIFRVHFSFGSFFLYICILIQTADLVLQEDAF